MPIIETHARVSFRHLDPEAREEAVQEVVANACRAYVRLVQLKKTDMAYPTVLAKYGVAQVKDGRKVGGKLNVLDISSEYCQKRKGVVVERLDQFDDEENQWKEAVVVDTRIGPRARHREFPRRFCRVAQESHSPRPPHCRVARLGQSHDRCGQAVQGVCGAGEPTSAGVGRNLGESLSAMSRCPRWRNAQSTRLWPASMPAP